MNLHITKAEGKTLLRALEDPSVTDRRVAALYNKVRLALAGVDSESGQALRSIYKDAETACELTRRIKRHLYSLRSKEAAEAMAFLKKPEQ